MPPGSQPNYDFLNAEPPTKSRFSLPASFDHLSGISILTILALLVIIFMIVLFGGSGSAYKNEVDIIARGQEIIRVSALATQGAQDQDLKNLVATVNTNLSSQKYQLVAYLSTHGKKVDLSKEVLYKNSSTDTQLNSATQAGNLDQFYKSYVKTNLGAYQTALQQAYKTAKASEKTLLNNDYNANNAILTNL